MKGIPNHGMDCCGLINSNGPFYGVAPGCKILPVKCNTVPDLVGLPFMAMSTINYLQLLNKMAPYVDVILFSFEETHFSKVVIRRINELATTGGRNSKGVLMIWAAGNDNSRLKSQISDLPNVAMVGAICSRAYRSHYSNYGSGLRLCAPSNNSDFPDRDIWQQTDSLPLYSLRSIKPFIKFGGTSGAAALV